MDRRKFFKSCAGFLGLGCLGGLLVRTAKPKTRWVCYAYPFEQKRVLVGNKMIYVARQARPPHLQLGHDAEWKEFLGYKWLYNARAGGKVPYAKLGLPLSELR